MRSVWAHSARTGSTRRCVDHDRGCDATPGSPAPAGSACARVRSPGERVVDTCKRGVWSAEPGRLAGPASADDCRAGPGRDHARAGELADFWLDDDVPTGRRRRRLRDAAGGRFARVDLSQRAAIRPAEYGRVVGRGYRWLAYLGKRLAGPPILCDSTAAALTVRFEL